MPRAPILKPKIKLLVTEILRRGPASFSEIKKGLVKALGRRISDGNLVYALKDLREQGFIEKTIDGRWVLTSRYPLLALMRVVEESLKNYDPVVIEDYGILLCDPKSIDRGLNFYHWKVSLWGLRSHFWDAAELFMRRVYLDYATRILESLTHEAREKVVEALLKLTYLGYKSLMFEDRGEKGLGEFDEEHLSSFLYKGLEIAGYEDDPFLYNLCIHNVLGDLARLGLSIAKELPTGWKREELRKDAPKLAELLKNELLDKLARLRLAMVICLDESMFAKPLSLHHRFERWFEALKSGALDHRRHIFMDVAELRQWEKKLDEECRPLIEWQSQQKPTSRVDKALIVLLKEREKRRADIRRIVDALQNEWQKLDRLSLLIEFKRLLEKELAGELSLEERRKFEEMMHEKLDWREPWTLGDLYKYHPRGKTPQFYEEILEEILLRRERRSRIHGILDKALKGVLDKRRLSELKYKGGIYFGDIIANRLSKSE